MGYTVKLQLPLWPGSLQYLLGQLYIQPPLLLLHFFSFSLCLCTHERSYYSLLLSPIPQSSYDGDVKRKWSLGLKKIKWNHGGDVALKLDFHWIMSGLTLSTLGLISKHATFIHCNHNYLLIYEVSHCIISKISFKCDLGYDYSMKSVLTKKSMMLSFQILPYIKKSKSMALRNISLLR